MRSKHGEAREVREGESGEILERSWAAREGYLGTSIFIVLSEALAHDKDFKIFATNSKPSHLISKLSYKLIVAGK